jgi:hypothetical protein
VLEVDAAVGLVDLLAAGAAALDELLLEFALGHPPRLLEQRAWFGRGHSLLLLVLAKPFVVVSVVSRSSGSRRTEGSHHRHAAELQGHAAAAARTTRY